MNKRLLEFVRSVGHQTLALPYESDDDELITHFVWLLHISRADLCDVEDRATELAFRIFGSDPLPFFIGVATPEKTKTLLAQASAPLFERSNTASGPATVNAGVGRGQGTGPSLPVSVIRGFVSHGFAGSSNTASGRLSFRPPPAASRGSGGTVGGQINAG